MEAHSRATLAVKAPAHRPGREDTSTEAAESDEGVLRPLKVNMACLMSSLYALPAWMLHTSLTDMMMLHALF